MTPSCGGARVEVFAQVAAESISSSEERSLRSGSIARPGPLQLRRGRARRRPAAASPRRASATARAHPARPPRRAAPRSAPGSACSTHRDPVGARAPKSFSQRVADRLRLAARDVEAAAGQVVGLVRGERERERRRSRPRRPGPSGGGAPGTRESLIISSRIGCASQLSAAAAGRVCEERSLRELAGRELLGDEQVAAPRRCRRRGAASMSRSGSERACRAKPSPRAKR